VKGEITVPTLPCGPGDATIANKKFPVTGTMDYDISSPTRILQSIKLTSSTNIGTSTLPAISGGGHGATGGVFVKANPAAPATFELEATFVSPAFACNIDPVTTTLRINKGDMAVQSFHYIPDGEHFIDIQNGRPGLRRLRIEVNDRPYTTLNLRSGRTIHINAASAMTKGNNTLTFIGLGETGSFANINVSNVAPSSPVESENEASVQGAGIWGRLRYEQ
jgi:hypothetical protein